MAKGSSNCNGFVIINGNYMRVLLSISIALFLYGCSGKQESIKLESSSITTQNFSIIDPSFIERDFAKYYNGYFKNQDSCFFKAFVKFYFDSSRYIPYRSLKECDISTIHDDQIVFDFSLIRKHKTNEYLFYGLYDIYELIHSDKIKLGSVVPFENKALEDVLNELLKGNLPAYESLRAQMLKAYIVSLYYWNFEGIDGVPAPIFSKTLSFDEFVDKYRSHDNSSAIDSLPASKKQLFVFEMNYIGAVIFRYDFTSDGHIMIEEFIVPKIDRIKVMRSDGTPDYLDSCL